jgi:hypothetical protein
MLRIACLGSLTGTPDFAANWDARRLDDLTTALTQGGAGLTTTTTLPRRARTAASI